MSSTPLPQFDTDLDPSLYQPTPATLDFLRATITSDDEALKERVIETQKELSGTQCFSVGGRLTDFHQSVLSGFGYAFYFARLPELVIAHQQHSSLSMHTSLPVHSPANE